MNGYGFYVDLISECVCLSSSSDTSTPYPILRYIPPVIYTLFPCVISFHAYRRIT